MNAPRCHITPAGPRDRRNGLLAYCALTIGPYRIDGITIRRTLRGEYVVVYPSRQDRWGRTYPYFIPEDLDEREDLDEEILEAFWLEGEL